MKKHSRNTQGPGAWVLGGVASMLMCVSAFGQYAATQSTPISIPDSGTATPYPSKIDLTTSNVLGTIEKVSVTVNNLTHPYAPDLGFLLVGPNSKSVVLMSGSGGNPSGSAALTNVTLTFSDDASISLPTSSPLVTGTSYKPTDNDALSFTAPAPTSGYSTTLGTAFAAINPNGVWSLYVLDTTPGPPTTLTPAVGSWTLNLSTTPTVTTATNLVRVNENGSAGLNLTVQSSSVAAGSLTVTATKIPNLVTNFSVSGSGQSRTLTITPNATTFGTNTLTITVGDGIGSTTTTVTLEVPHVNQPPTIALSGSSFTTIAGFMTTNILVATLADPDINFDPNSVSNLNLTVTSSDSTVVAPADVFFNFLTTGGDKRSISLIPSGAGTGTATLTIKVDDLAITNSATVTVTVLPVPHPIFANGGAISAPALGSGSSTIVIPANTVAGLIGNVNILVNGLKGVVPGVSGSTFTLTPPSGPALTLLNNSGPSTPINYGQLQFADSASGSLPTSNNETNTISLAPASPLAGMAGINPNGTWTLTIANGAGTAVQAIDGWTLNLFVGPTIGAIANVNNNEETTNTVSFTVADIDGTVTNISGVVQVNAGMANITGSLSGNNATLTIVGNFNQFGTNTVLVTAKDNNGFSSTATFTLGLAFVDHAPTVGFIDRQVTSAGAVLGPLPVTVADVDTPLTSVTVSASSDNTKLIPISNIILQPTGGPGSGTYNLTIFPEGTVSGTANITITANDGTKTGSATFQVFVQAPGVPLFAIPSSILIVPQAVGIPYGSTNNVSGLIGTVEKVTVTLFDIIDPTPGNLELLLVGPTGQKVVLMAGAGGNNGVTNTTLVFDDAAVGPLPQNTQINSGIFTPTAYGTVSSFPAPAPGTPYATTLSSFNGSIPNGNWALYVVDTASGAGSRGSLISGGWQLSIQTAPNIPTIKDQQTTENVTARVTITVGDNQPGVNLTVTATGDPTLFQSPIAVSGSGATRTLTIVPVPYVFGTNVITVTATDASNNTATATFNMGIQAVAQPPLFTSVPGKQNVAAATQLGPLAFSVWPPQGSPLTVTASSPDNPGLVPSVTVTSTGNVSGTNTYTLSLIPAGVLTGTATITIVASDTNGLKATSSFTLTVNPTLAFANTNSISIPLGPLQPGQLQQGESTPYPSIISVKGLGGVVSSVQATLVGLNHQFPHDLDILLVSPDNSTAVMLMAHAASGGSANDVRITFKDGATPVPANGSLSSTTYGPANYASGLVLPAPAPAVTYSANLSAFNNLSPNGDWKLYILDDTYPDGGSVDSGWILFLQTAPGIAAIGHQTTLENTPLAIPLSISDASVDPTNVVVTVADSLDSPPTLATNLVITGTGASRTLTITPTLNLPSAYNALHSLTNLAGTNVITITANDPINNLTTVSSFILTVQYVNQTPTIATATNGVYVNENTFTTIPYTIGDVDSIIDKTNIVVTSSDQTILANSNIVVTGSAVAPGATGTINVKVTPTLNAHGSVTLSLVATDGNTFATNLLTLNVNHIWQGPTITAIPSPESAIVGSPTTNIAFTVGSVEVSTKTLQVTATSSNPALVPNTPANIVLGGSGDNRTIQLFTIGSISASSTITVSVTDASGQPNSTNTTSFVLNATLGTTTFANTAPITTAGVGKANLYPSPITVAGLVGATFKVTVTLPDFNHTAPTNLDVLLVERSTDLKTNAVVLMSGAGGGSNVSNLRVTFDDSGAALPSTSLSTATYKPGNNTKNLVLPGPAPTNTIWATSLAGAFNGFNPNGTWELYVNDRGASDVGNISTGWQLAIETAPTLTLAANSSPLILPENTSSNVSMTVGDMLNDASNLVVTVTSDDNTTLIPIRNVTFSGPPANSTASGAVTATITPAPLQSGTANLTFTVTRNDGATATANLVVNVTAVNVPPTISRLDTLTMAENTTQTLQFLVGDVDTPLANLVIKATSDNPAVIPNTGLTFFNSNTNQVFGLPNNNTPQTSLVSLNMTPAAFKSGSANITVTVTDPMPDGTNIVTSTFSLVVNPVVYPPFFISSPSAQSVAAGGTIANIPFAIASPISAANTLTMGGSSSDQTLVKNGNIAFGSDVSGTNRTVTITAESATSGGTATITLTATDPSNSATKTAQFAITVRPSRVRNYTNSAPITIVDNSTGQPYPSTIAVSNLLGPISKVTATLIGFTHSFPSDVGALLVGPAGQKLVLLNNAGAGTPASNLTLTFDQSAGSPIPQAPLATGSYQPEDYRQINFQGSAPAGPYTNTLAAYNGTSPNGTWSLYVEDFVSPDSGMISNGWSLAITTLPVVNGLTNITVQENTTARESFTVGDDTLSTPTFTFSATSDNQSVVTNNGVVFNGSGTNWTIAVNPVPNAFGSANITVTMVNGDGQTVNTTFKATFSQVFYPPTIAAITDQTITAGTSASVALNYGNIGLSQNQLTVAFQSSNTGLVPVANMKQVGTQLLISPIGVQTGSTLITVKVTNPNSQSTNTSFTLTVTPSSNPVFANTNGIVINDNNPATPYPSSITVSNLTGKIAKVTATALGLGHTYPADISMLLVGPQGQTVVLMSRAGGSASFSNTRVAFDDQAATVLPQFTLITDGTYQPTDYKSSDTFFSGPPAAPYGHALSVFNGTNPNGTWSLYVQDDQSPDSGVITGGWVLSITTTGPTITPINPVTTSENTSTSITFSVNSTVVNPSNLIVTASSSSSNPTGLVASVTVSGSGSGRSLLITPAANLPSAVTSNNGTGTITVTVTDGTLTNSESFPLTVKFVNQPPTIAGLSDQSTPADVTTNVSFTVSDVDTAASNLVVAASVSTPALGTATVSGSGGAETLTYAPKGVLGTNTVSVTVSDGVNKITNSFAVVTTAVLPPVLAAIPAQFTPLNTPTNVTLAITPAGGIGNFTYSSSSTNNALLKSVSFSVTGGAVVATLNVVSNMVGFDVVTIGVSDGVTNVTQSFPLTVTPKSLVVLSAIGTQNTSANNPKAVALTVTDPDTSVTNLTFTGTSTNKALVSGITFTFNGKNEVAVVNLVTNKGGVDFVTISVTDGFSTSSKSFVLNVSGGTTSGGPATLTASLSGTALTLNLVGTPNANYAIQSSSDLKTWSAVTTVTASGAGTASYPTTITGPALKFFRAQSQ